MNHPIRRKLYLLNEKQLAKICDFKPSYCSDQRRFDIENAMRFNFIEIKADDKSTHIQIYMELFIFIFGEENEKCRKKAHRTMCNDKK